MAGPDVICVGASKEAQEVLKVSILSLLYEQRCWKLIICRYIFCLLSHTYHQKILELHFRIIKRLHT